MQSMRVVLFLLICHIFLLVVVEAPDSCTDAPRCWTRDLHCQQPWERACNGVMCQQVCRRVALEPRLRMAMRTQRRLQRHLAVNTVQMLGTHNSHIAPVNGVGVEERYLEQLFERAALVENRTVIGNQRVSLWDQLEMGVRHLELDIHQLLPVTGPSIRVCHWDIAPPNLVLSVYDAERKARRRHAGTENSAVESASTTESASAAESDDSDAHVHLDWDYRRIGCHHKSPLFRDALAEIHAWLAVNREDVVTVYLDNRVFPRHAEDALEQVRSVFGPMLFTPKLLSERYGGRWPTMEMLMQDGYQVMFEHYDKLGWARRVPSANETIWNRDQLWREFGVHQFQGHPACLIDGVPVSSARYRALDSSLVFGPSKLFDGRASGFDGGDVERFTECGVSIVSVDQATPSLAARAVWTWDLAVGEPNVAHRCTALSTRTGRWYTRACNTALPVVCARLPGEIISAPRRSTHEHVFSMNHGANLDNEFVLVKAATPFGDAAQACPGGYEFALPVQSQDNARMWRAVHGAVSPTEFVWINHMLAEDDV